MSRFPLHKPFTTRCVCCGLSKSLTLSSPADTIQCEACRQHGLETTSRRGKDDRAHKQMWAFAFEEAVSTRDEEIASLREKLSVLTVRLGDYERQLDAKFDGLPAAEVEKYYENKLVVEAEQRASRAGYARDRSMEVLLRIDNLHHPRPSTAGCACGEPYGRCPVDAALEPQRDHLYKWRQQASERGTLPHDLRSQNT